MQIFGETPLYQATKRHLNNSSTVKNDEKMRWLNRLSVFVLFSTWKIKMTEMNNLYAVTFLDGSTQETWKQEGKKKEKCFHGPCPAALHVQVALIVPGCVHVGLRFAVDVGSSGVCMFHVLILMSSCFQLWSALSQSSWIRRYIRVTYYYYKMLKLVHRNRSEDHCNR